MKKVSTLLASLFLISCLITSCDSAEKESKNTDTSDPCAQFVDEYQEFCDDYLAVVKKMKADPTDMSAVADFNELDAKGRKMEQKANECQDSKYADKIMKITTKMMNSAAGL